MRSEVTRVCGDCIRSRLFSSSAFHLSLQSAIWRLKGRNRDERNLVRLSSPLKRRAFVPDALLGISNPPDPDRTYGVCEATHFRRCFLTAPPPTHTPYPPSASHSVSVYRNVTVLAQPSSRLTLGHVLISGEILLSFYFCGVFGDTGALCYKPEGRGFETR
jgi:hypothetical protein